MKVKKKCRLNRPPQRTVTQEEVEQIELYELICITGLEILAKDAENGSEVAQEILVAADKDLRDAINAIKSGHRPPPPSRMEAIIDRYDS